MKRCTVEHFTFTR